MNFSKSIKQLSEDIGTTEKELYKIFSLFSNSVEEYLAELDRDDYAFLEAHSHKLKGEAANLYLSSFEQIFKDIQKYCVEGNQIKIDDLVKVLKVEFHDYKEFLNTYFVSS